MIFSEKDDISTNHVIDWLLFFKAKFYRDNGRDYPSLLGYNNSFEISISNSNTNVELRANDIINQRDNLSIWFRRPCKHINEGINLSVHYDLPKKVTDKNLKNHDLIFRESFIHFITKKAKCFGSYEITGLNKIKVLESAVKNSLKIPDSLISNSKKKVLQFLTEHEEIICKPLYEVLIHQNKKKSYVSYTRYIKSKEEIKETFSPSLFQEYIDKEFEIRTFLFNNKFFTMAIFSQNNEKTKVDFREYDYKKMNRVIPYKLDKEIEMNLLNLMNDLDLNSGSIDLIKSKNGSTYFLEVNPVGQYDFVSQPCNYYIHKEIAENLCENE